MWNAPSRPVMPCTTRRVLLVDQDAHTVTSWAFSITARTPSSIAGRRRAARARPGSCRASSSLVPVSRITSGTSSGDCSQRLDDAARDVVAARDAAEDVEQDRAHAAAAVAARVAGDDLERRGHLLGVRRAADVEEVGRLAAVVLDQVHGRHRQPGAVHDAADVAVELDVGQPLLARQPRARRLLVGIAPGLPLAVPELGVVVERSPWRRAPAPGRRGVTASGLISASEQSPSR